ncbi:uncharacterized protein LOC131941653 isoform X2 [Physella acuta]|uniref:uncharacterized protein LOC131941653 isoform X2 n=1 Tax=Physella acuta TaxID=109671 RepID=UPI0027DDCF4F|nr:uncharacterized protein LOC131941653 isoform X2 [Physella acuta]
MWSSIEFKVFAVLMFAVGVWSDCREVDWSDSFNTIGLSQCDRLGDIIQGFCRSDYNPGYDHIGLLESAICCSKPSPWKDSTDFRNANWWSLFNRANAYVECPTGNFLTGLFRTQGWTILYIEEGRCNLAKGQSPRYGPCYDEDITSCFKQSGCCTCKNDTYVTGLYRGACDALSCINKLRCCAFM